MDAPLPYRVSMLAVGIWLVLVILGGALATDAATTRASRITVREALSYLSFRVQHLWLGARGDAHPC
jgi:hypothetical protein